uniref:Uncharacterized protein n=1 Tax=Setaria viridis TaxID=4556 RepID=A0A4U6W0I9_SETVI|nr:hypothetical protein SEVIR_2G404450v2 [Setaria viridis]
MKYRPPLGSDRPAPLATGRRPRRLGLHRRRSWCQNSRQRVSATQGLVFIDCRHGRGGRRRRARFGEPPAAAPKVPPGADWRLGGRIPPAGVHRRHAGSPGAAAASWFKKHYPSPEGEARVRVFESVRLTTAQPAAAGAGAQSAAPHGGGRDWGTGWKGTRGRRPRWW